MPVSDWKVLGNRLLLRVIELEDSPAASGGLTRPDSAIEDEAPQTTLGEVVAKGPAVDQFEIGQQVIVLKTWARVEIEADQFIMCDASDDVLLVRVDQWSQNVIKPHMMRIINESTTDLEVGVYVQPDVAEIWVLPPLGHRDLPSDTNIFYDRSRVGHLRIDGRRVGKTELR